ncbi:unannotated protein [freshwater metagenome]|uniref:Unannotated protein n=1 Tax=freshwater metagenome TaxID=449393 RepID=A0A6J7L7D9_9ZZZZ
MVCSMVEAAKAETAPTTAPATTASRIDAGGKMMAMMIARMAIPMEAPSPAHLPLLRLPEGSEEFHGSLPANS